MASVPRLVEAGLRHKNERVPIHHRQTEEKIAAYLDSTLLLVNATIRSAQVRIWTILSSSFLLTYQRLGILASAKATGPEPFSSVAARVL